MTDDRSDWPPSWLDPERYDLLTPLNVAALAHPLRLRMLRMLREDGPGTASTMAARLGESSGVTSYHLRVLADSGLVVEDTARGDRRDRWWRAAHEGTAFSFRVPGQLGDADQLATAEQYLRLVAQVSYEQVLDYVDSLAHRREELPTLPWQLGAPSLSLTHTEARELGEQILRLVAPYRRDHRGAARGEGGPDAADPDGEPRHRAVLQYQLLPDPYQRGAEPAAAPPAP